MTCAAGSGPLKNFSVESESESVSCPLPTTTTTVAPATTTTVPPTTTTTTAGSSYSCNQLEPGDCYFPANTTNFVGMNNPYASSGGTSSLGTVVANNFDDPSAGKLDPWGHQRIQLGGHQQHPPTQVVQSPTIPATAFTPTPASWTITPLSRRPTT